MKLSRPFRRGGGGSLPPLLVFFLPRGKSTLPRVHPRSKFIMVIYGATIFFMVTDLTASINGYINDDIGVVGAISNVWFLLCTLLVGGTIARALSYVQRAWMAGYEPRPKNGDMPGGRKPSYRL